MLKWIAFANQNKMHIGMTEFGRKYLLYKGNGTITLHFTDGDLVTPDYTFEFEDKNNE